MGRTKLTPKQQNEIKARSDEPVADLAKEFKVSAPTIYKLRNKAGKHPVSAIAALEAEIGKDEVRIAELLKGISEADLLKDQVKIKKAALETLRRLEASVRK